MEVLEIFGRTLMTLTTTAPLPPVLPSCSSSSGDRLFVCWNEMCFTLNFQTTRPHDQQCSPLGLSFDVNQRLIFFSKTMKSFFSAKTKSVFQLNYEERLEKRLQNTESSTVDKLQRGRRWKPTMPNYFSFKILKAFNISLIFKPSTGLLCCGINGSPDWVEVTLNCHPNIIQMSSTIHIYVLISHLVCSPGTRLVVLSPSSTSTTFTLPL